MSNQSLLYHSKGITPKLKTFIQAFTIFYLILGFILIMIPTFTDAPSVFCLLGVMLCIAFGLLVPQSYRTMIHSRLYIYEDHVEGIAINCVESNPDSLFPALAELTKMRDTARLKFSLPFQEITDVQKAAISSILPQVLISQGEKKYIVMAKDADKAYHILCDKVFGKAGASCCVCCGHDISAVAETCPNCGQLTRYGKNQKDHQKGQISSGKLQISVAIGAVITIIGLIILIPAMVDLNEISGYASLYASIYPSKAKKMVAKVILGWVVTCGGIGVALSNWIVHKLKPVR